MISDFFCPCALGERSLRIVRVKLPIVFSLSLFTNHDHGYITCVDKVLHMHWLNTLRCINYVYWNIYMHWTPVLAACAMSSRKYSIPRSSIVKPFNSCSIRTGASVILHILHGRTPGRLDIDRQTHVTTQTRSFITRLSAQLFRPRYLVAYVHT